MVEQTSDVVPRSVSAVSETRALGGRPERRCRSCGRPTYWVDHAKMYMHRPAGCPAAPMKLRSGEVGNAGFCGKCQEWNPDGPDLCLGRLRGVTSACCGHGTRTPHVAFGIAAFDYDPVGYSTVVLYGPAAEAYFAHVKERPDEPFSIDAEAWLRYERLHNAPVSDANPHQ